VTRVTDPQDPRGEESTGKDSEPYQCLCEEFVAVCEAAAVAASVWHGRGDGLSADLAAREAMLGALDEIDFRGKVIVGRGGAGSPCELRVGQDVGRGWAAEAVGAGTTGAGEPGMWDLAVDALEGRNAVAKGQAGALAVIAAGPAGSFMPVPEMYMQKIVVAGEAAGVTEIDAPVADNVRAVAAALGRPPSELSVVILDRPRHEELIAQVKKSGARVTLIGDGDISAGIAAAARVPGVDMSIGIGGSTEGIITAAALHCIAGQIQARFWPVSRHQVEQLQALSIGNIEASLTTTDLVGKNVVFAATAVTDGRFLKGVSSGGGLVRTETILMCSRCRKIRLVKAISGEAAGRGIAAWAR
jgi:fructose-1,6-bisphosphatase II